MCELFDKLAKSAIMESRDAFVRVRPLKGYDQDSVATLLGEVSKAEERRASTIVRNPELLAWTRRMRHEYIAKGFLMPLYSWDGRYGRSKARVSMFGDHILADEFIGQIFYKEAGHGWVLQESMWFWEYLTNGQETVLLRDSSLPEEYKLEGIPARLLWQELTALCRNLHCGGEEGGGLILTPDEAAAEWLSGTKEQRGYTEGDDGYLEPYVVPAIVRWIELFQQLDKMEALKLPLEVRPPWFHIARYTFFNVPIRRLPVFHGALTSGAKVNRFSFLDDSLSNDARELVANFLLAIPPALQSMLNDEDKRRETLMIRCWLWHHVGTKERKNGLTYGEIASLVQRPRSSIQAMVERFHRKLKGKLDAKLLGDVLHTSRGLGIGANLTYGKLFKLGFVPKRKREIDSFDDLDKLI